MFFSFNLCKIFGKRNLPIALMSKDLYVVFLWIQSFAVRSLGWVEMAEEDLAPGKSSVAVNNCIRQLSYCKNDIRDTVGIWGEVCSLCVIRVGCKIKRGCA